MTRQEFEKKYINAKTVALLLVTAMGTTFYFTWNYIAPVIFK